MQDRGDAEGAAEVVGVFAEARERVGGGAEQQVVDDPGVALGQGVERVGQGEHHVEVLGIEELLAARLQPALGGETLALGAMAVAAGVIEDAHGATAVANLLMSAQGGGAARLDGPHGLVLAGGQGMGAAVLGSMPTEDVGELDAGLVLPGRRPGGRRPAHWLAGRGAVRKLQKIQR